MPAHGEIQDATNLHRSHAWEYANAAARTAATGMVAADVGKLARQLDTNFLYMLIDDAPVTWQTVATGGVPAAHTHPSSDITDFAEAVDDRVGALVADSSSIDVTYNDAGNAESIAIIDEYVRDLVGGIVVAGTGIGVAVDDALNTITVSATASYTDEQARDAIGAALTAGTGIAITVNDAGDTIGIAATGGVTPGAHTHVAADITDFAEAVDDRTAALLTAGTGITLTYNDAAGTLTVAASGGAASAAFPVPGWIAGRWYGLLEQVAWNTAGPYALVANRLFLQPLAVPKATTIDRIGVAVSTLIAASTIRLGIYSPAADGTPGTLLLDAGTVSSATTGNKEITISQALAAGWYWLALSSSHGPTVNGMVTVFTHLLGQSSVGGSARANCWVKDIAGSSSALPGSFAISGASEIGGGPVPMVRAT